MRRLAWCALVVSAAVAMLAGPARAQQVQVEEFTLDNGMTFLLYPRTEQPNIIAAGWLARVGSVNERPGITGISHFFEHMMFKGTNTIGTKDPKKDAEFRVRQKAVKDKLMKLTLDEQYKRFRAGEIDDPWDPANDTQEMAELRGELKQLMEDQKAAIVNNEFDKVYTELGASGMNAFTSNDITFYFINVPSTKLELWAWMESDRLNDSVFREFYAERDVVHEERRLRTESTPTGVFQEQFDAMFWQSSPYSWPVIGWTSDLNSYTMEQAREYFDIYYRPNNLVGILVGDFDPAEAKATISRYFGRLTPGTVQPPPVVTLEMTQMAEKRMNAECDCQPQIEIRYHTVPFGHQDTWALNMMAEILNGRTGRLYKSMVEGAEIASSARASGGSPFEPAKYAGYFSFSAETKGSATPEQIEKAWYEQLERLQKEAVPDNELQKVKNQSAANAYRALQNNFFILIQLGIYENLGGWEWINNAPRELQKVTAADIQRVANEYFGKDNRSVAIYWRKAGLAAEESDPEFEALKEKIGPQMAAMAKKNVDQIRKSTDMGKLRETVAGMEEAKSSGQVPPQMAPMLDYLLKVVRERIDELEKAEGAKGAE